MIQTSRLIPGRAQALANSLSRTWLKARAERPFAAQSYHTALRLWLKCVGAGDGESAYRIGELYESGLGVARNPVEAASWYRRDAAGGHAVPQFCLGCITLRGAANDLGEIWKRSARDPAAAANVSRDLLARASKLDADPAQAIEWLERAAEGGVAEAETALGVVVLEGHGVAKDPARARRHFERAAAKDSASSQFCLGDIYFRGLGVDVDLSRGVDWYKKPPCRAISPGSSPSAPFTAQGRGASPIPSARSRSWNGPPRAATPTPPSCSGACRAETNLRKAAKADHLPAVLALAAFYSQGGPVVPDLR